MFKLIEFLWPLSEYHSLLLVINAGWHHCTGAVDAGPLNHKDCLFQDHLVGGPTYPVTAGELGNQGIEVSLPPWGAVAYRIMQVR